MTNYDRIRAMGVEEMAKFFDDMWEDDSKESTIHLWIEWLNYELNWLKSEAKE